MCKKKVLNDRCKKKSHVKKKKNKYIKKPHTHK